MAEIRIFNPTYTPRSFFRGGGKGETMAKHTYHRRHHHHYRSNPLGITSQTMKDAAFNTAGAIGSLFIANMVPSLGAGWTGVGVTAAAAVGASLVGGMLGGPKGREEVLKGGLTATMIRALHELGVAKNIGLGLYAPSWFGVPTASSQYLQASQANLGPYRRGAGTIFFPGPGGALVPAAPPAGVSGMGFHRFRSRYAGNY